MSEIRSNILKVMPDHENCCVIAGDKVFSKPTFITNYTEIPSLLDIRVGGNIRHERDKPKGNKTFNKELSEKLGLPPTKWKKVFNSIAKDVWVNPVKYYVDRLAIGAGGRIDTKDLENIWRNKEILEQASADGIENVIPILFALKCTPKEAKEKLGRSAWKKIAKNSFDRNNLLSRHIFHREATVIKGINLPSTVLKYNIIDFSSFESLEWAVNNRDCYLKDKIRLRLLSNFYKDTERMADLLGENFNPNWSLKRMKEEHDKFSKAITKQKYSDVPFEHYHEIGDIVLEYNGWYATWLKSPHEIALEGNAMKHCVSAYISRCRDGGYYVFSITNPEGERYSTLGIRVNSCNVALIGQHHCAMNKKVKAEEAKTLADKAEHELDTRLKKEKA